MVDKGSGDRDLMRKSCLSEPTGSPLFTHIFTYDDAAVVALLLKSFHSDARRSTDQHFPR
jgi:hypothetical protein